MEPILRLWQAFAQRLRYKSERGASLVEYALLVALIAIVCVVAISFLGSSASRTFGSAGSQLAP